MEETINDSKSFTKYFGWSDLSTLSKLVLAYGNSNDIEYAVELLEDGPTKPYLEGENIKSKDGTDIQEMMLQHLIRNGVRQKQLKKLIESYMKVL